MAKHRPSGFIVVLPQAIIEIPQDSNLSWLTLFYALPKELVEKRAAYLNLPRNIKKLLASPEHRKLIETDAFLELVWDCYAWSAWQFFQVPKKDGTYQDIPGDWQHYSGDFPLWRWSYEIIRHFRMKFENEMEWSFQRLFLMGMDDEFPWLTYFQHICDKYNSIYKVQMPKITPHVCRHTFCSNMAKSGVNPKTLQYIMGHSDIGVTLNTYTHIGYEDAQNEMLEIGSLPQENVRLPRPKRVS